jgi:hypothetical protein
MTKFTITRLVQVVQATVVKAPSKEEAVALSKKLAWKEWKTIDRKNRSNYKADTVTYN